jgi:CHAT domain-containing protein
LDTETARGRVRSRPAKQTGTPAPVHPYAHPYYWAPFVLIGDPN